MHLPVSCRLQGTFESDSKDSVSSALCRRCMLGSPDKRISCDSAPSA